MERSPEIGEAPDFIFESSGTVDWEPVCVDDVTPPKIVYGSQALHTSAL